MSEENTTPPADETPAVSNETTAENTTPAAETPELPEVGLKVEDAGTLKKKITVTIPEARITAKMNEMFGELSHTALVPGFRIGHAPRRLIEKRFGKEITSDVRNAIIGESLGKALEKSELKVISEPELDLDKIELPEKGDLEFGFEVEVAPEFELPELKGIKIQKRKFDITDEKAMEYLDQLRQNRARFDVTTEGAAEGDAVTAGAKITGEGIDVDRPGLHLRVAPGQIEGLPLVDLGKELAGKKAGDTVALTIKVPEAHPTEAWRGKDVTVTISVSEVHRRVLPELDETFAQQLGFDNLVGLREFVKDRLQMQVAQDQQRNLRDQIVQYLVEGTKLDVPEGVATRHAARSLQRRYVELLQQGVPREKIDENMAQLQAAAAEQSRTSLKVSFILGKVADLEKIEVSDGEVNSRISQIAASYNRRPERLRADMEQEGTLGELQSAIVEEKALDLLLERAEITEVEDKAPDTPEPAKE